MASLSASEISGEGFFNAKENSEALARTAAAGSLIVVEAQKGEASEAGSSKSEKSKETGMAQPLIEESDFPSEGERDPFFVSSRSWKEE